MTYSKAEGIIGTIDLMKKSILAKAFRGELGTNNSAEQPTIEVLKTMLMENCREGLGGKKLVEKH